MRTSLYNLLLILAMLPLVCLAQNETTTFQDQFTYRFEDSRVPIEVKMSVPGYYDADNNKVYNGAFTASGKENLSGGGAAGTFSYTATGTYVHGKLNGNFTVKHVQYFTSPQKITASGELKAAFDNGVPTGTWTISEVYSGFGESEENQVTVIFMEGKLKKIKHSDGDYLTIQEDGTVSCYWNEDVYSHNINSSTYYTPKGYQDMDDQAWSIVKQYTRGDIDLAGLIKNGYTLSENYETLEGIIGWVNDELYASSSFDIESLGLRYFYNHFNLLDHLPEKVSFKKYMLTKVNFSSEEKVLSELGDELSFEVNKDKLIAIKQMVNNNHLNDNIFFTDEVKAKALEFIAQKEKEIQRTNELYVQINMLDRQVTANDKTYERTYCRYMQRIWDSKSFGKDTTFLIQYINAANMMIDVCKYHAQCDSLFALIKTTNPVLYKEITTNIHVPQLYNFQVLETFYLGDFKKWQSSLDIYEMLNNTYASLKENNVAILAITASYATASVQNYKSFSTKSIKPLNQSILLNVDLMRDIISKQTTCLAFIEALRTIDSNHTNITDQTVAFADIAKAYQAYYKALDLVWTPDKDLQILRSIQLEQTNCLAFIAERLKVANNNATIMTNAASYKSILKAYQTYMKTVDLTWAPGMQVQKLIDIQTVQDHFVKALNSTAVQDIDTKLKKNKDKTLDGVLNILKTA